MNIYIIALNLFFCFSNCQKDKLIISLASNLKSIKNVEKVINSILNQNVHYSLYKIILFLSKNEFNNNNAIPSELLSLKKSKKIRILLINENFTSQSRLLLAMKKYPNNPILIISDNIIFPYGWLEMFLKDHKKYKNSAISASLQYFFGKNLEIKEFAEGYKGEKFGKFNQVTDMIFNFAIINTDLGGTLYPPYFFKNNTFYDSKLFLDITKDSDEFWQSSFIMIENKILRQSSKIYDYTKYIINDNNYNINYKKKKRIFENGKSSFIKYFSDFTKVVDNRQKKIIISFTSYTSRFSLLPLLLKSIKQQTFPIDKIFLFLYEEDKKNYNFSIKEFNIITVKENLQPHKKYYYAMQFFRDYAIIIIDDDIYYSKYLFESLYNSYLEYPNLITGGRSHYMKYRINGEIDKYSNWKFEQRNVVHPDFNIFLTGGGGTLYPPDILNINKNYLNLINETITSDDIILKYFSNLKGIPGKCIGNQYLMGLPDIISSKGNPLYPINIINNDINIKKINFGISHLILRNLCVSYRNIQTGLIIYLFDIHNINIINNKTIFNIYAYSYCPIDKSMIFNIYFEQKVANCNFNCSNDFNMNNYNEMPLIAACSINEIVSNFDDYFFPEVESFYNIPMKLSNYRKNLKIIFKDCYYKESNNYILTALFYQNITKGYELGIKINNKLYICKLEKEVIYLNNFNYFPNEKDLFCTISPKKQFSKNYISGLPNKLWISKKRNIEITNIFIITRIVLDDINPKQIIIIGKLINNLQNDLNNLIIRFISPNFEINCSIKSISKEVQAQIYCINKRKIIKSQFLMENQAIYTDDGILLLINEETFIEIYFASVFGFQVGDESALLDRDKKIKNINILKDNNISKFYYYFIIILIIIISFIKYYLFLKSKFERKK